MRTSLFFGILFLSLSLVAQSNLTVFNNGGQKFYLIMNGIKQNSVAQTNVVVSGIKNGGYSVKLIFEDGKTKDIDKNFFLDTPQDVTTRVVFKKGVGKLQLVSMEPVAGTVAAGSVTYRPDNTAVFSDAVTTTTTTTTQTVSTESSTVGGNTTNGNGNGSVGIQFTATTPRPTTPNTNTPVTPSNDGNGRVNISVTDPVNGENINMNVNMDMNGAVVDPNAQNVNMNMNVNVSGNGNQQNTSTTRPGANANVNVGTTINSSTQQTTTNGANVNVNVNGNGVNPSVNATVPGATTNVTVNGGTVTQNSSNTTITTTTTTTTNASTTVNGTTNVNNGSNTTNTVGGTSNGRMVCSKTLSNVETLKTELNGYSFEDDRVGALKISLKNKCLYAADAVQILDLFTFDANQLEVAKFLSDHLLDYDNASSLAAKFAFDSSKMEYMEYVGRD
ncbi:MAG: DUF4476 domain-containing protein [Crocinitomicaceae bacterium]|nr:DUF4476 domain-containing protein [Crocinitomicaceae bacterium]